MKAIIFARVSSDKQEDNNSLDSQIFNMKKYCTKKNLEIIREPIRLVESSTRGEREQFYEMIDFIKKQKEPIALICDAVDRLQRSFKEVPILEELRLSGKLVLHFLRECQILDKKANAAQIMGYQVFVLMAANYANTISDNVKRGFDEKRRNGESLGHVPMGYITKEGEVNLDESKAILIKHLFEDYSTGNYSCKELAIKYGKLGLINKKSGKLLSNSQIDRMISHPFYYGFIEDIDEDDKKMERPHKYERIIDKYLFDLCQDIKKGRGYHKYKRTEEGFILKGLIKCHHCECSYSPYTKKGHIYIRPNNKRVNCKMCNNINEKKVLSQLKDAIRNITIPKQYIEEIKGAVKKSIEVEYQEHSITIDKLSAEHRNIKQKIYNWNMRCAEDLSITSAERNDVLKSLKNRLDEIEVELSQLEQADKRFAITVDFMLDLLSNSYSIFESSRIEEKREILKLLFSNLALDHEKLVITYNKSFISFINCGEFTEWSGWRESNPHNQLGRLELYH